MMESSMGNGTIASDYGIRLPPRKRLLAGLKRQNWSSDSAPALHFKSTVLRARFEELLRLRHSSPEEAAEVSRAAASEAADAAVAARTAAVEKMANAVRARDFARSVLEVLDPVYCKKSGMGEENYSAKRKGKKKRVAVELLYTPKFSGGACEDDEDLARKLHRAINSSPRNSTTRKKCENSAKTRGRDGEENSIYESDSKSAGCLSMAKGKVPLNCNSNYFEKDGGFCQSSEKSGHRSKSDAVSAAKKGKVYKKKLLLSQCVNKEGKGCNPTRLPSPPEPVIECREGNSSVVDVKHNCDDQKLVETESVWKSKKLKLSQFYSERKFLRPLPSVAAASALVKAD